MGAPLLEDVPNVAPGQGTVVPPVAAPPAQLSPEDASALAGVPGVDPEALKKMQAGVAARQPEPVVPQAAPQVPQAAPLNPLGIAGYVPGTSSSSTTQTILSPEAKAAQKKADEAAQAEIEATRRQSEVTQQKTAIQAQEARTVASQAQDAQTQAIADQNAKAQAGKEHLGRISQAVTDAKAAKIDPDRWWNNRSTGQKIATTLATAFDAMGAAWSKSGRTPTIDAIHHAIDRDVESQKLAFEAKQRGVQMEETLYGAARTAGADDALAKATVRQTALDATQKKFQADLTEKTLGPEQQAAADATIARMEQSRQQNALHVAELTAKHVSSTSSRTPVTNAQVAAAQNGPGGKDAPILASDLAGQGWHVENPRLAQTVINKRAMTKEVLTRMNNAQASLEAQDQLIKLRKEHGAEAWDQGALQAYDQYRETAIQKYAASMDMPNTDATQHKLEGMFPDASALTTKGVAGTLQGIAHGVGIGKDPVLERWQASRKESEVNFTNNLGIPGLRYVGKNAPTVTAEYPKGGKTYLQMSDGTWRVK